MSTAVPRSGWPAASIASGQLPGTETHDADSRRAAALLASIAAEAAPQSQSPTPARQAEQNKAQRVRRRRGGAVARGITGKLARCQHRQRTDARLRRPPRARRSETRGGVPRERGRRDRTARPPKPIARIRGQTQGKAGAKVSTRTRSETLPRSAPNAHSANPSRTHGHACEQRVTHRARNGTQRRLTTATASLPSPTTNTASHATGSPTPSRG